MGSEAEDTENEKPTQMDQSNNKLHPNTLSPENRANGYEAVTNNQISYDGGGDSHGDGKAGLLHPHSLLPMPVPPESLKANENDDAPSSLSVAGSMPTIGSYIRQRSNHLSEAIAKRVSSFRQSMEEENNGESLAKEVTEFNLSGVKVVVKQKPEEEQAMKGRISFFSRSGCRDCTAVRRFFRVKGLKFVEINIDVFTERESELRERTGSTSVPQIFFNEKLIGGLVALNSLRNSGEFERRVAELVAEKPPGDDAPAPPVYGFDYLDENRTDEMVGVVSVLRQRLPIQDRLKRMKIVKNCFEGNELVEVLVQHLDCTRNKAVEIGKQLSRKQFIHHVFGENDFEEGNHLYRFLEHEPFIPRCFNFRGATNDNEPKTTATICERLTKIMSAILESYASDDRQHVDYEAISKSEEFRRYVNMTLDLQRLNLLELSENEKLAFFLNLYNAMVIHAVISVGCNRRPPYSLVKPFSTGDKRLEVALVKLNQLFHFGLCNGTKSSPKVRFFSPHRVVDELRGAAREFFETDGIEVDLEKRTVHLTSIFKWFSGDFGHDKDILMWIINYLGPNKAGLVTHLLEEKVVCVDKYKFLGRSRFYNAVERFGVVESHAGLVSWSGTRFIRAPSPIV
ncbi:Winged helix-like DNA-binding domain superfamily [Sesbania bispinosa]|nr:Winged helix-like DNA-binding domain superfamily [Sesbania bispinosa]